MFWLIYWWSYPPSQRHASLWPFSLCRSASQCSSRGVVMKNICKICELKFLCHSADVCRWWTKSLARATIEYALGEIWKQWGLLNQISGRFPSFDLPGFARAWFQLRKYWYFRPKDHMIPRDTGNSKKTGSALFWPVLAKKITEGNKEKKSTKTSKWCAAGILFISIPWQKTRDFICRTRQLFEERRLQLFSKAPPSKKPRPETLKI